MGFKKYLVFGLILIIVVGMYVHSLIDASYSISLAGITLSLPISVWVILPALLLYIFTMLHLMFYGTLGFFRYRKIRSDANKFVENSKRALLGRTIEDNNYKSDVFKLPGAVLPLLNADPKRYRDYRIYDDGVQDILDTKHKINDGESVDLSRYSLKSDNALLLKNYENMLKSDKSYAVSILKKCQDPTLRHAAAVAMAEYSPMSELTKHNVKVDREIFNVLIQRISKDKEFSMSNDDILKYADELEFNDSELVTLCRDLKNVFNPDERIEFSKDLLDKFPNNGSDAYLYTMFDLQMIDKARDLLDNSSKDEHIKFKHLLFLKDSGRSFDIDLFI